jgi:hypothetical protein
VKVSKEFLCKNVEVLKEEQYKSNFSLQSSFFSRFVVVKVGCSLKKPCSLLPKKKSAF